MTDDRFAQLDALATEDLRHRAFELARERSDLKFFVSVLRHVPDAYAAEQVDGSTGSIADSITEVIGMWSEFTGHGYGKNEPLLRAAFIDYLMKNS